jgi:hypothetical protein
MIRDNWNCRLMKRALNRKPARFCTGGTVTDMTQGNKNEQWFLKRDDFNVFRADPATANDKLAVRAMSDD